MTTTDLVPSTVPFGDAPRDDGPFGNALVAGLDTSIANGLFGDAQVGEILDPPLADDPIARSAAWAKAYYQWLGELRAESTRNSYQRAWKDFRTYTGKDPWLILSSDVRDWVQDLQVRPIAANIAKGLINKGYRKDKYGFAASTINQYLAGISSFYTFVMRYYLVYDVEGRERPLHDGINPVSPIRRPKNKKARQAHYLPPKGLISLLKAIKQDSLQGLRDYALFLGWIFTGRRNTEWRELRRGDLVSIGGKTFHVWTGKNKNEPQQHELAPNVVAAIRKYLQAAGRPLETLDESDYIFTPLSDVATRLPNVDGTVWTRNRSISLGHSNKLLKKYAQRAGLNAAILHIHALRHSAAMLRDASGDDIKTISRMLGHSNVAITMRYLDHLKGVSDNSWRIAAALLELPTMEEEKSDHSPHPR
jgi:integrase